MVTPLPQTLDQQRSQRVGDRKGQPFPSFDEKGEFRVIGIFLGQGIAGFEAILVLQPLRFEAPIMLESEGARAGLAAAEIKSPIASRNSRAMSTA